MTRIEAHLADPCDPETGARLTEALGAAAALVLPGAAVAVTVHAGGATGTDAAALVRGFLAAMEARDLDRARAMLSPEVEMIFPGTAPMRDIAEVIAWAGPRYRFVRKSYAAVDAFGTAPAIVYARGTLGGEWPDGTAFSGIRFIDRFEVEGGLIRRQEVWNDLAEIRAAR